MYVGDLEEVGFLTLRGNMPPEIFAASSSVSSPDFGGMFPRSIVFFSSDTGHLRKESFNLHDARIKQGRSSTPGRVFRV